MDLAHLTAEETGNPPPEKLIENEGRARYQEWLAVNGRKAAYLAWEISSVQFSSSQFGHTVIRKSKVQK